MYRQGIDDITGTGSLDDDDYNITKYNMSDQLCLFSIEITFGNHSNFYTPLSKYSSFFYESIVCNAFGRLQS